jgi:hypothetical protein
MDNTDKILLENKICRKRFSDLTKDNIGQKIIISNYVMKEHYGYFIISALNVPMFQCHWCRKMEAEMKCCASCHNFFFCSKECQRLAWKASEHREYHHNKHSCGFWQNRGKLDLRIHCLEVINSKNEKQYFKLDGGYYHWMNVNEVIKWLKEIKDENIRDDIPFDVLIYYLPKFSYSRGTTTSDIFDNFIDSYGKQESFLY